MNIDFDHFRGSMIADEILNNLDTERRLLIIKNLQPKLGKDGNQWVYMLGEMPVHYLAGWGDTPHDAMEDFIRNFYNEKIEEKTMSKERDEMIKKVKIFKQYAGECPPSQEIADFVLKCLETATEHHAKSLAESEAKYERLAAWVNGRLLRREGEAEKMKAELTANGTTVSVDIDAADWAKIVPEKSRRWRPREGERCYRIAVTGEIEDRQYDEYSNVVAFDLVRGNCFRTHEEAEQALAVIHARARIEDYLDAHPEMWFEPDWADYLQYKLVPLWDYTHSKWTDATWSTFQPVGELYYFATEALALQFAADNDADLKLIAGINS